MRHLLTYVGLSLTVAVALAMTACVPGQHVSWPGVDGQDIALTAAPPRVGFGETTSITVTGGTGVYEFSAAGGTISSSGVFTAGTTAGVFDITATDTSGRSATTSLTIYGPLHLTPNGQTSARAHGTRLLLTATPGRGPYTFTISHGSGTLYDTGDGVTPRDGVSIASNEIYYDTIDSGPEELAVHVQVVDSIAGSAPKSSPDITVKGSGEPDTDFGTKKDGVVVLDVNPLCAGCDNKVVSLQIGRDDDLLYVLAKSSAIGTPTQFAVARVNPKGELDSTFNNGAAILTLGNEADEPLSLELANVKNSYYPVVTAKLATGDTTSVYRFDNNGSLDTNFAASVAGQDFFAAGSMMGEAGDFFMLPSVGIGSTPKFHVGLFNGTNPIPISDLPVDDSTVTEPGGTVRALLPLNLSDLYVGGSFSSYRGVAHSYGIARLDATDGKRAVIQYGGVTGFDDSVLALASDSGGQVIVGGEFTHFGGERAMHLAKLNTSGQLDTSSDVGDGFDGAVHALLVDGFDNVIAGGSFSKFRGGGHDGLVGLTPTFGVNGAFNPVALNGGASVNALAVAVTTQIFVGGQFTQPATSAKNFAVLTSTGANSGCISSTHKGFNGVVNAIVSDNVGNFIYVGGEFDKYDTTSLASDNLVRLIASGCVLDTSFVPPSFDGAVRALALDSVNSVLYVGGDFSAKLMKLKLFLPTEGLADLAFAPTFLPSTASVRSLALSGTSKLIVGGDFRKINGTFVNNVASFALASFGVSGALDTTFSGAAVPSGFSDKFANPFLLPFPGPDSASGGRALLVGRNGSLLDGPTLRGAMTIAAFKYDSNGNLSKDDSFNGDPVTLRPRQGGEAIRPTAVGMNRDLVDGTIAMAGTTTGDQVWVASMRPGATFLDYGFNTTSGSSAPRSTGLYVEKDGAVVVVGGHRLNGLGRATLRRFQAPNISGARSYDTGFPPVKDPSNLLGTSDSNIDEGFEALAPRRDSMGRITVGGYRSDAASGNTHRKVLLYRYWP